MIEVFAVPIVLVTLIVPFLFIKHPGRGVPWSLATIRNVLILVEEIRDLNLRRLLTLPLRAKQTRISIVRLLVLQWLNKCTISQTD